MGDLIIVNNKDVNLVPEAKALIIELEQKKKEIDEMIKEYRAEILKQMEAHNIRKIDCGEIAFTYKDAYDKFTFESKKFKEENPDLYDQYLKRSEMPASILVKIRE